MTKEIAVRKQLLKLEMIQEYCGKMSWDWQILTVQPITVLRSLQVAVDKFLWIH